MDKDRENELTCSLCQVTYSSKGVKNRHVKKFHPDLSDETKVLKKHILCSLCTTKEPFNSYNELNKHLTNNHSIIIKESVFNFRNLEEFKVWQSQENRVVNYYCSSTHNFKNGRRNIIYSCNRSNREGFQSSAQKRNEKAGGSIRIQGVCPSRMILNISKNEVVANWIETHVGHEDKLRTKSLTKAEEKNIVGQLAAGVSVNRILQDARIIKNEKLERINLISHQYYQNDVSHFIQGTTNRNDYTATPYNFNETRELKMAQIVNFGKTLDENTFNNFMRELMELKRKYEEVPERNCKKIKTEKQTYCPKKN